MRLRITFSKSGALRYIGHLDLHKLWERSFRRADLQVIYSQGFHPQPKIQLASALPLGFSSRCELVDVWVNSEVDLTELPGRLSKSVPSGLGILKVETIDEKIPPLQTQVVSAEYEITLLNSSQERGLAKKIETCLLETTIPRERRGKPYDLRPLIESMRVIDPSDNNNVRFMVQLAAREGATGRPEEVLDALGIPYEDIRVERSALLFKVNS